MSTEAQKLPSDFEPVKSEPLKEEPATPTGPERMNSYRRWEPTP